MTFLVAPAFHAVYCQMDAAAGWNQAAVAGVGVALNRALVTIPGFQTGEFTWSVEPNLDELACRRQGAIITFSTSGKDQREGCNQSQDQDAQRARSRRCLRLWLWRFAQLVPGTERQLDRGLLRDCPSKPDS